MDKKKMFILFFTLTLTLALALYTSAEQGDKEAGKKIYNKKCWWCHGEKGEGNGPAAGFLNPPPRDFTMGVYKYKNSPPGQVARDEDIFRMISEGMPGTMLGTGMPAWKDVLSEKDRWDLVEYIKSFTDLFQTEKASGEISFGSEVSSSEDSIKKGKEAFKKAKCYECHGENGKGDAMKKLKDDWSFRVWPRNLTKPWTFRAGSEPKDIFTRVSVGIPGTPMPAFADPKSETKLTDEERWHVVNYVKSIADDSKRLKEGEIVVKAKYVEGNLPEDVNAPEWNTASSTAFQLVPQIIAKERFFKPTNDGVTVRALFNGKEIAFLLEWDDRTKSIPGDADAEKLSEGEVFEDAIAIQLPTAIPEAMQKPYFGHGDKEMGVNMWYWNTGNTSGSQVVKVLDATGVGSAKPRDAAKTDVKGKGEYKGGIWKVILKRSLTTSNIKDDLQFESGKFTPIAFANWDGSNGEKGSKHTMTTWYWLLLEPKAGSKVYTYPAAAVIILVIGQLWFARGMRKDYENK
ncbi:MAG: c-type cytochrome [Nitrospinae bacterium]|nr:c-type cytochrome [Nitrospinota bacterium]